MVDKADYDSVSFFNVVGIVITIVVGFLFLYALANTLMFLRKIIYKLRIIMKNSYIIEKACMGLPVDTGNRSNGYVERKQLFREEIIRSWNLRY